MKTIRSFAKTNLAYLCFMIAMVLSEMFCAVFWQNLPVCQIIYFSVMLSVLMISAYDYYEDFVALGSKNRGLFNVILALIVSLTMQVFQGGIELFNTEIEPFIINPFNLSAICVLLFIIASNIELSCCCKKERLLPLLGFLIVIIYIITFALMTNFKFFRIYTTSYSDIRFTPIVPLVSQLLFYCILIMLYPVAKYFVCKQYSNEDNEEVELSI